MRFPRPGTTTLCRYTRSINHHHRALHTARLHTSSTSTTTLLGSSQLPRHSRTHQPSPHPAYSTIRHLASASASEPQRIAILGGGIAGLASAHYVAREFPRCKVVLFERGEETGGWVRSRRVGLAGGSKEEGGDGESRSVLFEMGPRSLRNSTVTAGLVSPTFPIPSAWRNA